MKHFVGFCAALVLFCAPAFGLTDGAKQYLEKLRKSSRDTSYETKSNEPAILQAEKEPASEQNMSAATETQLSYFVAADPYFTPKKPEEIFIYINKTEDGLKKVVKIISVWPTAVDAKSKDQHNRPLHYAVKIGDLRAVKTLVQFGAYLNGVNDSNCTPLDYCKHQDIAEYLIANGAVNKSKKCESTQSNESKEQQANATADSNKTYTANPIVESNYYYSAPTKKSTRSSGKVYVRPYTKKDGTRVSGHYRRR